MKLIILLILITFCIQPLSAGNPNKILTETDYISTIFSYENTFSVVEDNVSNQTHTISITPIPANEYLTINPGTNVEAIFVLLNLHGKEVLRIQFSGKTTIELDGISEGIYFAKITTEYAELLKRIIIKK